MNKIDSKDACRMAIGLIDAQLQALLLPLADPAVAQETQRILAGNALLAVGMFFQEHGIAATRTPEVQFLGHVCKAILNADTFRIEPGYVPGASFDKLEIHSSLDGARLFGDSANAGFMKTGDAVALLKRLAQSLRGTRDFVSGGDAG